MKVRWQIVIVMLIYLAGCGVVWAALRWPEWELAFLGGATLAAGCAIGWVKDKPRREWRRRNEAESREG